jgi:hypothetical protein
VPLQRIAVPLKLVHVGSRSAHAPHNPRAADANGHPTSAWSIDRGYVCAMPKTTIPNRGAASGY